MTGSNIKIKEGSVFIIPGECDYSSHTLTINKSTKEGNY